MKINPMITQWGQSSQFAKKKKILAKSTDIDDSRRKKTHLLQYGVVIEFI